MARDWQQQRYALDEVYGATAALFAQTHTAYEATRRRVVVEMIGLVTVILGTVVSAIAAAGQ